MTSTVHAGIRLLTSTPYSAGLAPHPFLLIPDCLENITRNHQRDPRNRPGGVLYLHVEPYLVLKQNVTEGVFRLHEITRKPVWIKRGSTQLRLASIKRRPSISETRSSLQTHEKDTLDRITRNATHAT